MTKFKSSLYESYLHLSKNYNYKILKDYEFKFSKEIGEYCFVKDIEIEGYSIIFKYKNDYYILDVLYNNLGNHIRNIDYNFLELNIFLDDKLEKIHLKDLDDKDFVVFDNKLDKIHLKDLDDKDFVVFDNLVKQFINFSILDTGDRIKFLLGKKD